MDGDLLRALSTNLDDGDRARVYALLQRNLLGRDVAAPDGTAAFPPPRRGLPREAGYRRTTLDPAER